jgi:hypothetical protein
MVLLVRRVEGGLASKHFLFSVFNFIKTFLLFVTDEDDKSARVFVPGKPFQPSLIFGGKVRRLPEWSTCQAW